MQASCAPDWRGGRGNGGGQPTNQLGPSMGARQKGRQRAPKDTRAAPIQRPVKPALMIHKSDTLCERPGAQVSQPQSASSSGLAAPVTAAAAAAAAECRPRKRHLRFWRANCEPREKWSRLLVGELTRGSLSLAPLCSCRRRQKQQRQSGAQVKLAFIITTIVMRPAQRGHLISGRAKEPNDGRRLAVGAALFTRRAIQRAPFCRQRS